MTPAVTTQAATMRRAPNGSPRRRVPMTAAMTTLVSRSAATEAMGARVGYIFNPGPEHHVRPVRAQMRQVSCDELELARRHAQEGLRWAR